MKSQLFSKGRLHLVSLPLTLFLLFSSGRIFANDSGEIISSPYSNCQQETITKTTMETDAEWRSAGNLALRAGQVTTRILEKNQENLEKMKECFSKTLAGDRNLPPKCEQDLQFIKKLVPAVRQARLHLAFAYSPNSQPIINVNNIDSYLNFSALTPPFLPLKEKFEPLTIDERNRIRQIFKNFLVVTKQKFETEGNKLRGQVRADQYPPSFEMYLSKFAETKELDAYLLGWPAWQAYQNTERDNFRKKHRQALLKQLVEYPILGLIRTANPTYEDFIRAFEKMIENNKAQLLKVANEMKQVEQHPTRSKTDIFSLTSFPISVGFVLTQDPQTCGIATNLALESTNYQTMKNLSLGALLLGSCIFFPPGAALVSGVGLLGHDVIDSNIVLQDKMQFVYTYPIGAGSLYKVNEAQDASFGVAANWILSPFFINGSVLFGKIKNVSKLIQSRP